MLKITIPLIALALLAACTAKVKSPDVEITPPTVKIDPDNGDFCPPGQAKKGRC